MAQGEVCPLLCPPSPPHTHFSTCTSYFTSHTSAPSVCLVPHRLLLLASHTECQEPTEVDRNGNGNPSSRRHPLPFWGLGIIKQHRLCPVTEMSHSVERLSIHYCGIISPDYYHTHLSLTQDVFVRM